MIALGECSVGILMPPLSFLEQYCSSCRLRIIVVRENCMLAQESRTATTAPKT